MSKFIEIDHDSPRAFFLNLEKIEMVDTAMNTVYSVTGDEYTLDDNDFALVMRYVKENQYK